MGSFEYGEAEAIPGTPYRVTQWIASGGMGTVYEVEDVGLGKRFALKTLRGSLGGARDLEQRMRDEAKILGRLTHPNVVQVFTAGVTGDAFALPFIVMERLVGWTLRDTIAERGALGLRTSAMITLELLGALEQAHEHGLVHRDIKPDNVFLHRIKRDVCTTKLLDFGVADLVTRANEDRGAFFGTFRYASPEALAGRGVSASSDLYSVGVLLYEMLTGRHPFSRAKTRDEITRAHALETPELPAQWPPALRELVGSVLAKRPASRPPDAWTFASRLRRITASLGLAADALDARDVAASRAAAANEETRAGSADADDTVRDLTHDVTGRELLETAHARSSRKAPSVHEEETAFASYACTTVVPT